VYVTVGADNILFTPDTLLSYSKVTYSVTPTTDGYGTKVTMTVTVPTVMSSSWFRTRYTASQGPWGTLDVYSSTYGTSDKAMITTFMLPIP
jgi:hypothetical protein